MAYFNSSLYDSGNNLTFEVNPDFGSTTGKEFANTIKESLGGVEYAFQAHTGKKTWTLTWSNISTTFKTQLENFRNAVSGNYQSFTYNDGSSNYTVRMSADSLQFQESTLNRYQTTINMKEVSPS
jgi:hypothetical protein